MGWVSAGRAVCTVDMFCGGLQVAGVVQCKTPLSRSPGVAAESRAPNILVQLAPSKEGRQSSYRPAEPYKHATIHTPSFAIVTVSAMYASCRVASDAPFSRALVPVCVQRTRECVTRRAASPAWPCILLSYCPASRIVHHVARIALSIQLAVTVIQHSLTHHSASISHSLTHFETCATRSLST